MLDPPVNVAAYLPQMAQRHPHKQAIVCPTGRDAHGRVRYTHLTFLQLDQETDRYAHGLEAAGLRRGMRTILMVRPGLDFFALTFALYKIGAVPVLIDPGMGRASLVDCLRSVAAEAFIGVPLAHLLRRLHPSAFHSIRISIVTGRRPWKYVFGSRALADLRADPWRPYAMAPTNVDDPAAIIFTTGSTGPPKGVLYRHGNFDAQVRILREHFGIAPDEIDLPTFPLFALFDPALGMTAVIPDMDPTRPAHVDPRKIIEAIHDQGVTHMFGSPALLNRVAQYGEAHEVKLPSLKRVISAGAPVPPATLERFARMLASDGRIHTPYGATEALPVASITHAEVLGDTRSQTEAGLGTCVGRPVAGATVRIIRITDDPIAEWSTDLALPIGEVGEIAVKGPMVTCEYIANDRANALAKIREGDRVWHRMGDLGRLDEQGRLWFYGRKAHRVITPAATLFTEPVEAIFNRHPAVFRSALVGVGAPPDQSPVVCIELNEGPSPDQRVLLDELAALARGHAVTRSIATFLFHPSFPVDIRHNSKIFREKLATWAAEEGMKIEHK